MAYCSNAELILESGSELSTSILDGLIAAADRKIKTRILLKNLTPPSSDDSLKTASIELSKAGIITYNRMTGTQTKSVKVGDITIQDDIDAAIKALTEAAYSSIDAYIAQQKSSISPLPGMVVVGRRGRRIGEYEEMTEAEEEDY